MKKRLAGLSKVTVTSLLAASLIAPNVASAAPYDIWNGTIKVGNLKDAILNDDSALLQDILDNANTYRYELGGKTYLYSEADAIAVANPNLTPTELDNKIATDLADKAENAPEESTDLVVQSVSAITTSVEKSANQQLKIQVNGNKEVTVKELTDAGYIVKFLYNQSASSNFNATTGIVNATGLNNFKYAVQITSAEGTAITSEWVDVQVVDVAAITEITKLQLSNNSNIINVNETSVSVEALEALNAGGKTVTDNLPTVESIVSSDTTVLYANMDKTLTARKAGNVTLTVKFVGVEKTATLSVEVKAEQEAVSISEATVKIALSTPKIQFKTLDANGKQLVAPANTATNLSVVVKNAEGTTVGSTQTDTVAAFAVGKDFGAGQSGITTAGMYTVEVSTTAGKKIGSYTLEVVDTTSAITDEYKILTDDNTNSATLDINAGLTSANTVTVTVSNYAQGIALDNTSLDLSVATAFAVESSNTDVVNVIVNEDNKYKLDLTAGTKTGDATITLYTVAGDYKEAVATFTVTVKNTTPQVTSLIVKDAADPIVISQSQLKDQNAIKAAVVSKVQSNLDNFTADNIASVEVTTQGTIIVTIAAKNGGKEFVLPYEEKDDVKPTVQISADKTLVKEGDKVKFIATFSEAIDETTIPQIELSTGATAGPANMTKVSDTVWTYEYTVVSGVNGVIKAKITSAKDLASNPASGTFVDQADDTTVSTDTTVPTITSVTSATLNKSSKTLVLTVVGAGEVNDLVDVTKITVKDTDASLVYTLTDSTGVVTNATTLTITLSDTDLAAIADAAGMDVTVDVADGVLKDAAGNVSTNFGMQQTDKTVTVS